MVVLGLGALGVNSARAQGLVLGAAGGIAAPVNSDFTDDFKLGWQVMVMGEYVFNNPLFGVRLDGAWSQMKSQDSRSTTLDEVRIITGFGDIVVHLLAKSATSVDIYVLGGAGFASVRHTFNDATPTMTETKFAVQGGVGLGIPIGSRFQIFGEGRWNTAFASEPLIDYSFGSAVAGFKVQL